MVWRKVWKLSPVMPGPPHAPDDKLRDQVGTVADWRERIAELEREAVGAEQVVMETRAARHEATSRALVF